MSGNDPRRKKLNTLINREGIVSQMNDTRWMRLIEALQDASLPLRYRIKLLTDTEFEVSEWGTSFVKVPPNYIELSTSGPVLALEVEWLEIDATGPWAFGIVDQVLANPNDYSEEVANLLHTVKVPFSITGTVFRVTGHLRPFANMNR